MAKREALSSRLAMEPATPPQYAFPYQQYPIQYGAPVGNWNAAGCTDWNLPGNLACGEASWYPAYSQNRGFTDAYAEPELRTTNPGDTALYQYNQLGQSATWGNVPYFYQTPQQAFADAQSRASIPTDFRLATSIGQQLVNPINSQLADFYNTNLGDITTYQYEDPEQVEISGSGPYFYHSPEQTFGVIQSSASVPMEPQLASPNASGLAFPADSQFALPIDPSLASAIDPRLASPIVPRLASPIDSQVDLQIGVRVPQVTNAMQSNDCPAEMSLSQPAVVAGGYSSDDTGNSFSTPESPEQESAGDDRSPSVPSGEEEEDCDMPDENSGSESKDDSTDRSSRDVSTSTPDKAPREAQSGLRFGSYEEALKACPGPGWTPIRPDNTLPQTDQDRIEIVVRLLKAFQNRVGVHDKPGKVFDSRWALRDEYGNVVEYYDPIVMEKVCWDVLRVSEDMHTYSGAAHLPLHDREFNKSIFKTKNWTFGTRIDWMERLMRDFKGRCDKLIKGTELIMYVASPEEIYTTSEANRVQNDKRQAYLEKGRKVVRKQAEKDDTGAEAILKQAKRQPKRASTPRTSSSADISRNASSSSGSDLNEAEQVEAGQKLKKTRGRSKKSPDSASRPTGVRKSKRRTN